jgi:hypothetical protein
VTGWGALVTVLDPPGATALLAIRLPGAVLAPSGAVSEYSVTEASTASSGTRDFCCEARVYAANTVGTFTGLAAPGRSVTTSRETTLAAGVSAARIRPSASSCWHTVTNRALLTGFPDMFRLLQVWGEESHA